ncbi:GTPase Era [uncultured Dubosiella sp.]|uniref:GTPase Era n=2 Tax=uncultured Dubosiella sp. TaxID=1937011 RepID=UPI0025B44517|nr:GTPase Era [uncultured Dubosiella sp.]
MENYKSGFIAIVGRPNAGKSTLLNALMKEKIAIMTDTPNTTRNNIAGILTKDDVQYVFVDTPGIHKPQQQLGRVLNKNAYTAMEDCDVIAWIVDITQRFGPGDEFILNRIKSLHKPVLLLVNKIDRFSKEKMIQALMAWQQKYDFDEIIPLSAKDQENLDEVLATIKNYLPDGPAMYPDEMKTDHDENFRICEVIREKILNKTEEEIPHSIAVVLEKKEIRDGKVFINALVIVDRDSQKGILIGKQGSMIKEIRIASQRELSKMLGMRIDLELYVRVEKNWRNKEQKIREFGLDELNEGTR